MCTTELSAVSLSYADFQSRGVKASRALEAKRTITNKQLIGLSANNVDSHHGWVKDVDNLGGGHLEFPIIGDEDRNVSTLYGMLDNQDKTNVDAKGLPFTVRTVFISKSSSLSLMVESRRARNECGTDLIVDPSKKIRLTLAYPASTGR